MTPGADPHSTAAQTDRPATRVAASPALSQCVAQLLRGSVMASLCGLGLDIVDVDEVARHAQRHSYRRQLCGDDEIEACLRTPDPAAAFAERFALKEACMKALGAGIRQGLWFRQIEVESAGGARPKLRLRRCALERFEESGADRLEAAVARCGPVMVALVLVGTAAAPRAPPRCSVVREGQD